MIILLFHVTIILFFSELLQILLLASFIFTSVTIINVIKLFKNTFHRKIKLIEIFQRQEQNLKMLYCWAQVLLCHTAESSGPPSWDHHRSPHLYKYRKEGYLSSKLRSCKIKALIYNFAKGQRKMAVFKLRYRSQTFSHIGSNLCKKLMKTKSFQ